MLQTLEILGRTVLQFDDGSSIVLRDHGWVSFLWYLMREGFIPAGYYISIENDCIRWSKSTKLNVLPNGTF